MTCEHGCWCLSLTEMCFDESLHPDCLSCRTLSLLSGFLINNICTLHFFTISTHGVRFATEVPRDRTATGGPSRRPVPAAGACPPAICQPGWGPGAQTGETSGNIWRAQLWHLYFPYLFIYITVNNALVLVTCIFMVPFQAIIHYNDFYFSSCMFKMLFSETTNQSPSWFLREGKKPVLSFGQALQRLSIQNLATLRNVTDMVCGGKTYTVTQIQTYDSENFFLCVTHYSR